MRCITISLLALGAAGIHVDETPASFPCDVHLNTEDGQAYCKPSFLLAGCQKCGSSSFYLGIKANPDFAYTKKKELLFWKANSCPPKDDRPEDISSANASKWFDKFTDVPAMEGATTSAQITGEFSVTYFECAKCPHIFREIVPNAKVMLILREPLSRSMSRYKESRAFHHPWSFKPWSRFSTRKLALLKECLASAKGGVFEEADCASRSNVIGWSMYAKFLKNWINAGYTKDNLKIVYLDDWTANPQEVLRSTEDYLGIRHYEPQFDLAMKRNAEGDYGWKKDDKTVDDASKPRKSQAKRDDPVAGKPKAWHAIDLVTADPVLDFYREALEEYTQVVQENGWDAPPAAWLNSLTSQQGSYQRAQLERSQIIKQQ